MSIRNYLDAVRQLNENLTNNQLQRIQGTLKQVTGAMPEQIKYHGFQSWEAYFSSKAAAQKMLQVYNLKAKAISQDKDSGQYVVTVSKDNFK